MISRARNPRLALIVIATVLGTWSLWQGRIIGALFLLAAGMLVWGHFRYGAVWAAWAALRRGDMRRAKSLLELTRSPGRLSPRNRAYYRWAAGYLAYAGNELRVARRHLESVAKDKLRTSNDRSLVSCHLAEVALRLGDAAAARAQLAEARAEDHKPGVDILIETVEKMFATQA